MTTHRDHTSDITNELQVWRQGDLTLDADLFFLSLARLDQPISETARQLASSRTENGQSFSEIPDPIADDVSGLIVLTQTCDLVQPSADRPYVEVAPLIKVESMMLKEIRQLRRPGFAYVPGVSQHQLVADLDRVMTVEKSVVASWRRIPGRTTDEERRRFAEALARKRARFAFPNDFIVAISKFSKHVKNRHGKNHAEGAHLEALREIRLRATPSWDDDLVSIDFWFIKETEPTGLYPDWADIIDKWMGLVDVSGRFRVENSIACYLKDITAQDYVDTDRLDFDHLSV